MLQAFGRTIKYLHLYSPIVTLAAYSLVTFVMFTTIWRFHGLKHVELDKDAGMGVDWSTAIYYSNMCMLAFTPPGEAPPKNAKARALVTAQATLSWIVLFWLMGSAPEGTGQLASRLVSS